MKLHRLALPLALAALPAAPLCATTVFPQTFTCPVGGEEFEDYVVGSTSSWGQRPDGRAIGGVSPWPVVECPSNGFPIYQREFSDAELARLGELVATPTYLAMRESDSTYRRIWWLRKETGADDYSLAWNLLAASWQVDELPELKARYQRDFAQAVDALAREEEKAEDWFWYRLRAANAYRELGQFDDAARLLRETDRPEFMPEDENAREGARTLIDGLLALVAEENTYHEPTNLVGAQNSVRRCTRQADAMTAVEQTACDSPEHRAAIKEFEENQSKRGAMEEAMADAEAMAEAAGAAIDAAAEEAAEAVEAAEQGD